MAGIVDAMNFACDAIRPWRSLVVVLAASLAAQRPAAPRDVDTATGTVRIRSEHLRVALRDDDGSQTAEMHAFGYLGDDATRPVTFLWNGGPGLPTMLLHTGFLAPKVADLAGRGELADNARTLVDVTDLVYVDPVGTGFSKAVAPHEDDRFFGVREDADAAARFVAELVRARGWGERPVYLCGESYGGLRVAAMLAPLAARGIVPAGLILISPALEWRYLRPGPDGATTHLVAVDAVPTLAALAAHDDERRGAAARADVDAACRFAIGPLLDAVRAGAVPDDLPDGELARELARVTNGRTMRTVRRRDTYDARLRYRPSFVGGIRHRATSNALQTILRTSFGIASSSDYATSARGFGLRWRGFDGDPLGTSNVSAPQMIAAACKDGGGPRVLLAGGGYDTVVLFGTARRLCHEGAFGSCKLTLRDYPAGHMIYVDDAAHEAFARDLRSWFGEQAR